MKKLTSQQMEQTQGGIVLIIALVGFGLGFLAALIIKDAVS
jgi:lactobin A/cerein 7B family class IIb bacteriocin